MTKSFFVITIIELKFEKIEIVNGAFVIVEEE